MGVSISHQPRPGEELVKEVKSGNNDIHIFRGEDYLRSVIVQMPGYEFKILHEKANSEDSPDFSAIIEDAENHLKNYVGE